MDATVVLATVLFFLSGSAPGQQVGEQTPETPAAQYTFIEIDITEPACVEKAETAADATAEALENPAIIPPAAILEPIGKEVEPLDLIEPLFVEVPDAAIAAGIASGADEELAEKLANDEPVNDGSTATVETTELDVESLDAIQPIILEGEGLMPEPQPDAVEEPVDDPVTATESPFVQSLQVIEPGFAPAADGVTVPKQVIVEDAYGNANPETTELTE
jgi:hypothetical protein